MPVTKYYSRGGELYGESANGVATSYMTDALGSTIGAITTAGVRNRYVYSPYGKQISKSGTDPDPKYLWAGQAQSRSTSRSYAEQYNRRRHVSSTTAQWTTRDSLWPRQRPYGYAGQSPVSRNDPSGLLDLIPAMLPPVPLPVHFPWMPPFPPSPPLYPAPPPLPSPRPGCPGWWPTNWPPPDQYPFPAPPPQSPKPPPVSRPVQLAPDPLPVPCPGTEDEVPPNYGCSNLINKGYQDPPNGLQDCCNCCQCMYDNLAGQTAGAVVEVLLGLGGEVSEVTVRILYNPEWFQICCEACPENKGVKIISK